ncbi:MAG: hypothetical protein Q4B70_18220, partial [Lachnospiraceae bacterium]|nr:hypothetical protein [Lachnospiraceae bacterium]
MIKDKLRKLKNCYRLARRIPEENLGWGGDWLELNLLLLVHSIEKGMSLPIPKPCFGYEKAKELLELLETYHREGYDRDKYAFVEGISTLSAYLTYTDNDTSFFIERFNVISDGINLNDAGYVQISSMETIYSALDFEQ